MLPIGQQLWEMHLLTFEKYPPLQAPETYNLSRILDQMKKGAPRQRLAATDGRESPGGRFPNGAPIRPQLKGEAPCIAIKGSSVPCSW